MAGMRERYGGMAHCLPLRRSIELDAERAARGAPPHDLRDYRLGGLHQRKTEGDASSGTGAGVTQGKDAPSYQSRGGSGSLGGKEALSSEGWGAAPSGLTID